VHDNSQLSRSKIYDILNKQRSVRFQWLNALQKEKQMDFQAKRVPRSYRQTINATPDQVFPLICPVREVEWLEDWDYRMIYSKTNLAEEGAVFSTSYEGEEDTIWIITTHDSTTHEVEFVCVTPHQEQAY